MIEHETNFSVTVITVTWNADKYLERCLESVKMQETPSDCLVEHLIIDGCSTDGTLEILKKWQAQAPAVRRFISEPDKGLYDAMNKGALLSRGKIIVFLNADDRFASSSAIYHSVQPILNENCDYTCATAKFVAIDGTFLSYAIPDLSLPYINHPFNTQTMFVKKNDFLTLGGHDLSYSIAADDEFDCKLIQAEKKGKIIDEVTVIAQDGGFGVSHYYAHERARLLKTFEKDIMQRCELNHNYAFEYFLALMRISKVHPSNSKLTYRQKSAELLKELHINAWRNWPVLCRIVSKATIFLVLEKVRKGGFVEKYSFSNFFISFLLKTSLFFKKINI